jgi:hypothetical protein
MYNGLSMSIEMGWKPFRAVLLIASAFALLGCSDPGNTPITYERIVIDTYSPNGSYTADTYIDLFDENGDPDADDPWSSDDTGEALASADSGNPDWPMMARIDYTGDLKPGDIYYIRVRGATETVDDPYAIRVLSLNVGDSLPGYVFLTPVVPPDDPDSGENDDDPVSTGGVPTNPVPIQLGNANSLSRSIDNPSGLPGDGDIDWFKLVLP